MTQHKADGEKEPINSWKLYQRWCKMAENTRESWIAAGKSIQTFSTLANAKIAEVVHSSKSPIEVSTVDREKFICLAFLVNYKISLNIHKCLMCNVLFIGKTSSCYYKIYANNRR